MAPSAAPLAHLLDAPLEQRVDLGVARAAPHLPHRALGQRAHHRVRIAQRPTGARARRPSIRPRRAGSPPAPRLRRRAWRGRPGPARGVGAGLSWRAPRRRAERRARAPRRQGERATGSHARPTSLRNAASSSVGTPRRWASSALLPGILAHDHVVRLLRHRAGHAPAEADDEVLAPGPGSARRRPPVSTMVLPSSGRGPSVRALLGHDDARRGRAGRWCRGCAARRRSA